MNFKRLQKIVMNSTCILRMYKIRLQYNEDYEDYDS